MVVIAMVVILRHVVAPSERLQRYKTADGKSQASSLMRAIRKGIHGRRRLRIQWQGTLFACVVAVLILLLVGKLAHTTRNRNSAGLTSFV